MILYLAAVHGWTIRQIDIVAAFLTGELDEEVYAEIPEGFAQFLRQFPDENDIGFNSDQDQVMLLLKSLHSKALQRLE